MALSYVIVQIQFEYVVCSLHLVLRNIAIITDNVITGQRLPAFGLASFT
jgi:hypothetical protein